MDSKPRVCVVTGTRAEYGLLYWTIRGLHESPDFDLQLIVTGMHLSPEFGLTYRKIEEDGLPITDKVEILLSSDTPVGVAKAMGLGLISLSEAFTRLKPNLVLLVGDRFETHAAACTAMVLGIPIAHCSGGELTEGVIDDAMRHSITKMSHLHLTATETYRNRVIQLGEQPDCVYVVGALGIENVRRMRLMDRSEFQAALGRPLRERNLLVTYHPVTLEPGATRDLFGELLAVLDELDDTLVIFTKPNADAGGRVIAEMIDQYVTDRAESALSFTSMGQRMYLSAMKHVNGVVGNSSSAIIEAPSLGTGTVNIGDRQRGRVLPDSVISAVESGESIRRAIDELLTDTHQVKTATVVNPYDAGNSSEIILRTLADRVERLSVKKRFFDLPVT